MEISSYLLLLQHMKKTRTTNKITTTNQHEVEKAGEKLGHLDLRTDQ
jgi:hypothetical protein